MNIECLKTSDDKYNIDIGNEIKFRNFTKKSVLEILKCFRLFENKAYTTYPEKLCGWDLSVTLVGDNIVTKISNMYHTYYTTFDKGDISEVIVKLTKATYSQYVDDTHYRMYHEALELASKFNEKPLEEILEESNKFCNATEEDRNGLRSEDWYNWSALMNIYYNKKVDLAKEEQKAFYKHLFYI